MPPRKRRKRQRPQTSARRMLPMTKRRKAVRLKAVNLQLERRVVRLLPQQKMAPSLLESPLESLPPSLLLESPVRERPVRTVQRLKARKTMAVVLSRRLLMLARQARTRPRKKRRRRRPKRKGRPN